MSFINLLIRVLVINGWLLAHYRANVAFHLSASFLKLLGGFAHRSEQLGKPLCTEKQKKDHGDDENLPSVQHGQYGFV